MNFTPKTGPLVAEILSGSVVLLLGYFAITHGESVPPVLAKNVAAAISLFALMAWLIGTFIDALRNVFLEAAWDRFQPVEWSFFVDGPADEIGNLDHYFFSFYMADLDIAIGVFLYLVFGRIFITRVLGFKAQYPCLVYLILGIVILVFALDAWSLRCEIKKFIDSRQQRRASEAGR